MSEEEKTKLFQKAFENTLEVLANNPKEAFNYLKLQEKYNNVLKKNAKLKIENKQLKEKKRKVREYIEKYESIKAYYEYFDEDGYDEYNYDENFKEDLLEIIGADE